MTKPIPITQAHADAALTVDALPSDVFRIEVPMKAHVRCLANCDEKSPEYTLLRNGIVVSEDSHQLMVHIRCDADKARAILRILAKECPEFSDELHVYPDPA
jgi:hypothetical protein